MSRFGIEDIKKVIDVLNKPAPIIFSSFCFECGKTFLSYDPLHNFENCISHKEYEHLKVKKIPESK